jgi:mannitol 2-dehydrogenase
VTHPTPTPLSDKTVGELDATVDKPAYDRSKLTTGIVHFGVGGFHRAHQAMYLDTLMNEGKALDWALCGVGVLPHDRRIVDTLTSQDGLYTLVVKHPDGRREPRVIGSIATMLFAPDDPQAVVDLLADERTRIASLTITEGGYLVNQVTGEFDATDPSIQADLRADFASGGSPTTAFGYLTAALHQRRRDGRPPFTVMSCDNLPDNGDVAKRMLCAFARLKDPELADWMEAEVPFPNCMVDRITPVTTPEDIERLGEEFGVADGWPVVCEPFTQWVLEDRFGAAGRPPFEAAGVQVVDDVVPYELMKLRLLNASHQALCYLGYLSGYRYAHEVAQDPLFAEFLLGYMKEEGMPTLPEVPGVDLNVYARQLIERFANPEVRDTLARLCAESSDRIPKWLVPVISANLESGGAFERSALVVASWARYAEGVDEKGEPIEVVDRYKDKVMAAARSHEEDELAFLRDRDFFGNLVDSEPFTTAYTAFLKSLHDNGARTTLEDLESNR